MIIETPGPNKTIIKKTIEIGGGVIIRIPGTLYQTTCKVLTINEEEESIEIKGVGFQGWILKADAKDAISPGDYAIDYAINVIGAN